MQYADMQLSCLIPAARSGQKQQSDTALWDTLHEQKCSERRHGLEVGWQVWLPPDRSPLEALQPAIKCGSDMGP